MISLASPAQKNDRQQEITAKGSAFPWLLCKRPRGGRKALAPKPALGVSKSVITKAAVEEGFTTLILWLADQEGGTTAAGLGTGWPGAPVRN